MFTQKTLCACVVVLIGYSPVIFEFSVRAKFNREAEVNIFWVNVSLKSSLKEFQSHLKKTLQYV